MNLDFDTKCNERYFRCVSLYAIQEQQSTYTMITFRPMPETKNGSL